MTDDAANATNVTPNIELPEGSASEGAFRMNLKTYAIALLVVAAVQTSALGWMIANRVSLIRNGQEIRLDIVPVDPRSLFRGDYVILSYEITRLDTEKLAGEDEFKSKSFIYVTLNRDADGSWKPVSLSKEMPEVKGGDGEAVIRGRVQWGRKQLRVKYGIESYFVEEGEGKRLEKLVGEKKLAVLVAVAADGVSAIKGLLIDGKLHYEEPLF